MLFVCLSGIVSDSRSSQATAASIANEPREAVIEVRGYKILGRVNTHVLGNNAVAYKTVVDLRYSAKGSGMWDPVANRGAPDVIRLAREAGVSTLRWPGGCGVHKFNWKLTVGPSEKRPGQPFGLPEFMRLVNEIKAEPIITLADYWGEAADAADLVEYLNAPVGQNPNGGVNWAAIRAADGHPEPYGMVWFEFGNETDHGPHSGSTWRVTESGRYTAEQYVRRYQEFRAAMRAVDPRIKLGAVLANDAKTVLSRWTEVVIRGTANTADFYVHHAYLPYYSGEDGAPNASDLYKTAFASAGQFDRFYEELNRYIRSVTGRNVPLAITEYNGHFVQDKPVPYRLSLGTAVQVADLVQVLLNPRHNIATAQYWQFANEYWGMVKGYTPPYTLRPAYHVFKLYHDHLGDRLLDTKVQSETYEQAGGFGVVPARGDGSRFELIGTPQAVVPNWRNSWVIGANAKLGEDGILGVEITKDDELNYHHSGIRLAAQPSTGYRVTAEIRAEGLTRLGAQLQVGDARGWRATKSAALSDMVHSNEWTDVKADYVTLPDTKEIEIMARRLERSPERGRFWIRNVRIQRFKPFVLPKIPFVSAIATRRNDTVSVFIVNRRIDAPSPVRIVAAGLSQARAWTLSGPSVDATNEVDPENVKVKELAIRLAEGAVQAVLPPHSFTIIEFDIREQTGSRH